MDFFREQDIARRNSRLLTLLFGIAVLVLIVLTNILLAGALFFQDMTASRAHDTGLEEFFYSVNWRLFFSVGGVISGVIGVVALFNWLRFSQGGSTVAEALG